MPVLINIRILLTGLSIIAILACLNSCREESFSPSQSDSFIKFFGSYDLDKGFDVISLNDGGYAIAGTTSKGRSGTNIILIRTDKYGNELWEPKQYGGDYNDHAYSLKVLPDGGFAILGSTELEANDRSIISNMYLIRTDSQGDTLWTRNYGGYSNDVGYHFDQTSDEGFILIGYTEDLISGITDILIVKVQSDGEEIWSVTHGGSSDDVGRYITQTDNGYIYAGYTKSYSQAGQSQSNILIAKTNSFGRIIFPYTYGNSKDDSGKSVIPHLEGGYVILGTTTNPSTNIKNVFLARVEEDISKPLWSKSFGGNINHVSSCLKMTADGSLIISGTKELSASNHVIFLLKTDGDGNQIFLKTFGGSGKQRAEAVDLTHDNGYIVAGSNELGGNSMITLIKTKASGDL